MQRNAVSRRIMRGQQQVIVRWMRRQIDRLRWKPERWAREAKLAPTTVTRAMSDSYQSVSSVPTLHALAKAARVPSVLDFLEGRAGVVPKPEVLAAMLGELLPAVGCDCRQQQLDQLGVALAQALAGLSELPAGTADSEQIARVLAQASRSAIRDGNGG